MEDIFKYVMHWTSVFMRIVEQCCILKSRTVISNGAGGVATDPVGPVSGRIIVGSDRRPEIKQAIEGKIVRFRSGRSRVRDKDCRSEPDRRSEAINFGAS